VSYVCLAVRGSIRDLIAMNLERSDVGSAASSNGRQVAA
jgi:hypothetical protein